MNQTSDSTDRRAVLERALRTIGDMQAKLDALEREKREAIAIIGMGCRFPGPAVTPEAFWDLLREGVDTVREVPRDRWDIDAAYDPDPDSPGKMYTRMGAFLEHVDQFDAGFFGMSARETLKTDPQQRLAVEVGWEALENAGIDPMSLSGTQTGVFLGITNPDYARVVERAGYQGLDAYHLTGNCLNFAAGRIAYHFGFRGPAMALDTACSSSGVSVHLACQSLRNRECNLALAGGVNLILSPELSIASTKARTLSPDGRCKTFDASANGYVRGEGCGVVVLKRLSDALADGDRIHAVIRGSAVNQDGASSGITVPNKDAQIEVIRQALERAGIEPNQVDYVEAHGTGTPLGDPIEVRALASVYSKGRGADRPLILGTVKTNVGHLESAAGIAGLIKVVLALQHRSIPRHLHFQKLNPAISLESIPARIPLQTMPWPDTNRARVAGVSSFGGSGTIVHTIVEEAPQSTLPVKRHSRTAQLFCISAKDPVALHALAGQYESSLAELPAESLADVCYTADSGRSHFHHRLAVAASSLSDLRDRLHAYQSGEEYAGLFQGEFSAGRKPGVVFLFTGQGGQYVNMARGLYQDELVFRQIVDRCDALLRPHLPRPLCSVLYPEPGEITPLNETQYTHVAMFAVQCGLAALWRSWGIEPALVMGHSVGEIVAATVAGQMSFEDGLMLMYERGRLMQSLPSTGLMASLLADENRAQAAIQPYRDRVSIAAINGPESTVISGERTAVEMVVRDLQNSSVKTKILNVSNAFHSPLVEPVLPELEAVARRVRYTTPQLPLFSSMRLETVGANNLLDAAYWRHNLRSTVRFSEAIQKLYEQGYRVFVEIGPSPVLVNMASQCVPPGDGVWLPSLRQDKEDSQQLLESAAQLYVKGLDINWRHFYQDRRAAKVTLPTYPFQRERHWVDSPHRLQHHAGAAGQETGHPLLGVRLSSPWPVFEQELSSATVSFLDQHRVFDKPVLPASAYLEAALAAAERIFDGQQGVVKNFVLARPMVVPEGGNRTMQAVITEAEPGAMTIRIFSCQRGENADHDEWLLHATGELTAAPREAAPELLDLAAMQRRCNQNVELTKFYEAARERGLEFGPDFHAMQKLWTTSGEVIGLVDAGLLADERYRIHPALLDACLQPVAALLPPAQTYLPQRLESFRLLRPPTGRIWSHVAIRQRPGNDSGEIAADIDVVDSEGQRVCEIRGLVLRQTRREALVPRSQEDLKDWLYELAWEEAPQGNASERQSSGFLPDPSRVADTLQTHLSESGPDAGLEQFAALLPHLEMLSTQYVSKALIDLGWNAAQQKQFTTESLAHHLRVPPRYHRLLSRMLEMLAEDGYLAHEGGEWKVLQAPPAGDPEARLSILLKSYPLCSAELTLTGRCGRQFAQAIRGEVEPLDLLFPNGSLDGVASLYKDSPYFGFYNRLTAQAISALATSLPAGQTLRVLEIGAGTGSVTSEVLPRLPQERTEYVFTDVSAVFGSKAREKFAAFPFVTYQVLDIEKEPTQQGFSPHNFDVVIAANALHATADLRQTLEHIRTLLRPGGLLLLLEATRQLRFADLIVGLTEGWWRFTDTKLRPSHALLPREKWNDLLHAEGFCEVAISPPPGGKGVLSNQCLLLARAPQAPRLAGQVSPPGRKWLLVGEADGAATRLEALLKSRGDICTRVAAGASRNDFADLLQQAAHDEAPLDEVVYFAPVGVPHSPEEWREVRDGVRNGCEPLLGLVQALVSHGKTRTRNLRIVTRGACPIDSGATSLSLRQYSVAAMASTISLEYPELNCVHIDLDPAGTGDEAGQLLEVFSGKRSEERRVAFRRGRRLVARLISSDAARSEAPKASGNGASQPRELTISSPGILENLRLTAVERREPGEGEVEIEVRASGLGFRDVLIALGSYPGSSLRLGFECVGKIVRMGPNVTSFHLGQRVMAVGAGGFASYLTIPVTRIAPVPANLTDEDAATIPSAFLTAQYALCRLGRISAGERILIHAAAGGVGLAAVQLAQRAGAEIFATAGTPEKRAYLKSLGVVHIMDSRSLAFAGEVMDITRGRGVDLVLNCLAGDFIRQSLSVTAANGRFLEIGKTGIWNEAQVAEFRNLSYFPIDLSLQFEKTPELVRSLFDDLLPGFADGSLRPLPRKTFTIGEAADAFRYMAQGRHMGKIVLSHPASGRHAVLSDDGKEVVLSPDASYLVTGGLSGLGLLAAQWLVERGAKNLVLMGRREPSAAALDALRSMQERGVRVSIVQGDVADREVLAGLFANFGHAMPPLRGILHAAGTVDDGVLAQQSWERFETVMASKVNGSWHLHTLSQDQPLDFFVLFSSAVSLLGSAGQANHVAACAFEDALAHYRHAQGLAALSINWGPWAEIGAAAQGTLSDRLQMKGFRLIDSQQGLRLLERLLLRNRVQVAAMSADWHLYADSLPPGHGASLLSRLSKAAALPAAKPPAAAQPALLERLRQTPAQKRRQVLEDHVRSQAIKVLGVSPSFRLDPNQGLATYGMDSLMTIELKNRLQVSVGKSLSSTIVFDHPTIAALAAYLDLHVLHAAEDSKPPVAGEKTHDQTSGLMEVTAMSEEEAEAILAKELSGPA